MTEYNFSFDKEQILNLSKSISFLVSHTMINAIQTGIQMNECEFLCDIMQFKESIDKHVVNLAANA